MNRRRFLGAATGATLSIGLAGCLRAPPEEERYRVRIEPGSPGQGDESLIESVIMYDGLAWTGGPSARLTFREYDDDFEVVIEEADDDRATYLIKQGTRRALVDAPPDNGNWEFPVTITAQSLDGRTLGVATCIQYDGRITPGGAGG